MKALQQGVEPVAKEEAVAPVAWSSPASLDLGQLMRLDQLRRLPTGPAVRFALHTCFTLLFTVWLVNGRDSAMSHAFGQLVRESVVEAEFLPADTQIATTFHDVSSITHVKQFLRGPLLDALFGAQTSYATGPFDPGWVNSQARLVGAARIRQVRVSTDTCATTLLSRLVPAAVCYPSLEVGQRRTAPIYGVNLGNDRRRVYRYTEQDEEPLLAVARQYYSGGYVADLPARRLHAYSILEQLELDGFLSSQVLPIRLATPL